MNNFFEIIIPVYNSEKWILQCINTALNQDYPKDKFLIKISDACSTDKTVEIINSLLPNNLITLYTHNNRKYPLENTKFLVNMSTKNSICVLVDGDDWLFDNQVLNRINKEYIENDLWMTCGSYVQYPSGIVPNCFIDFTDYEIENNLFRKTSKWPSHLRTFKKELFEKIKETDFFDSSNNYYTVSGDIAYTYPMLEMAGKKFKYIKNVNYVYNQTNPISDFVLIPTEQEKIAEIIKQKQPYERIHIL